MLKVGSFSLVTLLSLVVTFVVLEIYRTVVELYINKNFGQVNLLDLISIATYGKGLPVALLKIFCSERNSTG